MATMLTPQDKTTVILPSQTNPPGNGALYLSAHILLLWRRSSAFKNKNTATRNLLAILCHGKLTTDNIQLARTKWSKNKALDPGQGPDEQL